jgi:hypothetical protein
MRHSAPLTLVMLIAFIVGTARGDKPVELIIGESQFFNADYIKIRSVKSSGSGFEIGAMVTVKGTYILNSVETANLCFYSTTTSKQGAQPKPTPTQDSQRIKARQGKHKFSLSKVIRKDGSPHLTFYHPETGKPFGGVYFGDKSNVLMKKSWSYSPPQIRDWPKATAPQNDPY